MAIKKFYTTSGDGFVENSNYGGSEDNWSNIRNASVGTSVNYALSDTYCHYARQLTANIYQLSRGFFAFDTRELSAADEIISAKIYWKRNNVNFRNDSGYKEAYVTFIKASQASVSELSVSDYSEIDFTEIISSAERRNLSTLGGNIFFSFELNATGLAYINKGGYTKVAMVTGFDLEVMPPPVLISYYAQGYFSEASSENRPYLEITYTPRPAQAGFLLTMV
jgi:hypothetical protein